MQAHATTYLQSLQTSWSGSSPYTTWYLSLAPVFRSQPDIVHTVHHPHISITICHCHCHRIAFKQSIQHFTEIINSHQSTPVPYHIHMPTHDRTRASERQTHHRVCVCVCFVNSPMARYRVWSLNFMRKRRRGGVKTRRQKGALTSRARRE